MDSKRIFGPVRQGDNYHKYFITRFIENTVDQCDNEIGAKSFGNNSEKSLIVD